MQPPSLASVASQPVEQYLVRLAAALTTVEQTATQLAGAGYVTGKRVTANVDPTQISKALQANGTAPLNVTNLIGKLAQPQLAGVPLVTALPANTSPLSQDGALIRFNGILYYYDQSKDPGTWKPVTAVGLFLVGTHAQRISATYTPPKLYPDGSMFFESDRLLQYISIGGFWNYLAGTYAVPYASISALTLTAYDAGLLVHVNDYAHTLQWSGTAWKWANGDGSGAYIQGFVVDPDNTETGWALCDGSGTTYLLITGGALSTPSFTTPALTSNPAYTKLGSAFAGITAATAPVIASASTGLGISALTDTVQAGTGIADTFLTAVGLTDPGHTHIAGVTGEPQHLVFRPWFRR